MQVSGEVRREDKYPGIKGFPVLVKVLLSMPSFCQDLNNNDFCPIELIQKKIMKPVTFA